MKALMAAQQESANLPEAEPGADFSRTPRAWCSAPPTASPATPDDAEDVLQTVFLRMVKRGAGAEPVGNMASFLHRAAVNAALDLVRSRQNIRSVPLDELEPVLSEPAHRSPERIHHSGEIREWLRGALARLNPEDRRNVHAAVLRWKR